MAKTRKAATPPRARTRTPKGPKTKAALKRAAQAARAATLAQQKLFLEHYSGLGVITAAAKLAGIDRKRHYEWLEDTKKYPDYQASFDDAHEQACDRLEAEMVRRGAIGWDEPVFGKLPSNNGANAGNGIIGHIRKYSDRMLELALKARRPAVFRERFEHSGPEGGPIPSNFTITIDRSNDA